MRRPDPDVVDQKIHCNNLINSILAKIQANAAGADDSVMLDSRGFIAETNATHIFIVTDGVVETPRTLACPEGITRLNVLRLCKENGIPHHVRDISMAEVFRADEMFTTGTMGELAPVIDLDGRKIGEGKTGPMCLRLSELFKTLTENEGTKVV